MIGRVEVRLRRDALRERMREAVRREAARLALDALVEADDGSAPAFPDEKLTTGPPRAGLSRDV